MTEVSAPSLNTVLSSRPESTDSAWAIRRGRFSGGVSDGIDLVQLDNGLMSIDVVPTRGMGVWRAQCDGLSLGWNSPVKTPVHPQLMNLESRNKLGWLDGFNELVCRCGLSFNGPPGDDADVGSPIESDLTLHGKIANLPAHSVNTFRNIESGEIGVSGIVDESTLFGPQLRLEAKVVTTPGSAAFTIRDRVTNLGAGPTELELLYHTNFGRPFLEAGSTLHAPANKIVPRDDRAAEGINEHATYLGPTPGYSEQVYFFELIGDESGNSITLLKNHAGDLGVSLHFSTKQLPCFAQWKCTQEEQNGYVTGLEPATNFPNFKSFERRQNRVISLAPGETYETAIEIRVHRSADAVESVVQQIQELQGAAGPHVHREPTLPFCDVD